MFAMLFNQKIMEIHDPKQGRSQSILETGIQVWVHDKCVENFP